MAITLYGSCYTGWITLHKLSFTEHSSQQNWSVAMVLHSNQAKPTEHTRKGN